MVRSATSTALRVAARVAFRFAAGGNAVDFQGQDIMRVVDGKITELHHAEQMLKLTQQIIASTDTKPA